MVERIRTRTDNPFGQNEDQMAKILADKEMFEPMLRRAAGVVIDTDRPLDLVVDDVMAVALTVEGPATQPTVVLASASPRRLDLLREIGIEPIVEPADLDETLDDRVDVAAAVAGLASAKARAVAARRMGEPVLVIGADTLVVLDGRPLGKPADDADARTMLGRLSGREHQVMTGVAIVDAATGNDLGGVETTIVRFRTLTADEITDYVATGEPLDKAGAYGIQSGGGAFVESVDGDRSNVIGLPLPLVTRLLAQITDAR
jgi:septum formation protein